MKTAFKILPVVEENQSVCLLAEAGPDALSFLFYTKEPFKAEGFLSYQLEVNASAEQVKKQLEIIVDEEPLLRRSFSSVNIIYSIKEAMLVPRLYQQPMIKDEMLALVYGNQKEAAVFDEHIRGKEMVNIYRVSRMVTETFRELFPFSVAYHINTLLVPKLSSSGNQLHCIVYQHSIKIVLLKDGLVLLAQQFSYTTATDVVYHLINTCGQHGIDPSEIELGLSGMIEERSALYSALYNYFLQISFNELPANVILSEGFNEYPSHFFQYLILLSTCV